MPCQDRDYISVRSYFRTPEDVHRWVEVAFDELIAIFGFYKCGMGDSHSKEETAPVKCAEDVLRYCDRHYGDCNFYGRGCEGSIMTFSNRPSEAGWLFESLDDPRLMEHYETVFRGFASGGAWYARACCWSEYEARHDIDIPVPCEGRTFQYGERFCTNIDRYLPSLYWLNYLSHDYCEHIGIDVDGLVKEAEAWRYDFPEGVLVRLYERPTEWRDHDDRIRRVIDKLPYVFSLSWVPRPPEGLTPKEVRLWFERIIKEHPEWR